MELSYSDVLEYCMEEGIQLDDEMFSAIQEVMADPDLYASLLQENNTGLTYSDALEFFVENGIQLDGDQLSNLQESVGEKFNGYVAKGQETLDKLANSKVGHAAKSAKSGLENAKNTVNAVGKVTKANAQNTAARLRGIAHTPQGKAAAIAAGGTAAALAAAHLINKAKKKKEEEGK